MEVIKAKNGRPFSTREAAEKAQTENELHPDVYGVYPAPGDGGGFVLGKHAEQILMLSDALAQAETDKRLLREGANAPGGVDRELAGEAYFWVMFHGRTDAQEAEHIELAWQGDRITCRRETEVCLPQRFLNVADNAVQQLYEPTRRSENPYKKSGLLKRRAYTRVREGSRAEFLTMLKEGDDLTRRDMQLADRRADE